jgi:hypothetical protein
MAASKKTAQETPGFVPSAEVSNFLGITQQAVRDLARKGIIRKYTTQAGDRYNLPESIKAYIQYLRERASGNEYDIEIKKAEADLKRSKASREAYALAEIEGKMHRSEDVEAMTTDLVYTIRSMIMALPGRLAVDMANIKTAPEASIRIEQECHEILRELAAYKYDPEKYKQRVRDREGWKLVMNHDDESDD